jgi:hypothetical protein
MLLVLMLATMPWLGAAAASAQSCSRADLARTTDQIGASLRRLNAETAPRLQAKMRQLKELRGWSDGEFQDLAVAAAADSRTAALDKAANELFERIDMIGSAKGEGGVDCARVADLDAAGLELLSTMRAKATHTISRLDQLIAEASPALAKAPPAPSPSEVARDPSPPTPPAKAEAAKEPARTAEARPPRPAAPPAVAPPPVTSGWTTRTEAAPAAAVQPAPSETATAQPTPPAARPEADGYTIDEIREASRGFFGTISTSLASVIEHAFAQSGRPTAYVLGDEGGGAFLAGLRYGNGTLYLRSGGRQRVFWHGPSIGYDVGIAGSKTMFLIYGLSRAEELFSRFTGIDGSAFIVGGVGMTLLTDGRIVMSPIRSGVGLRLGASIGFVRFTSEPTWNPF